MRWKVDHALERLRDVSSVDVALDPAPSDEVVDVWVEDICWQVHVAGWYLRRPRWWRLADRNAWKAEWRELHTTGELLRKRAAASGA